MNSPDGVAVVRRGSRSASRRVHRHTAADRRVRKTEKAVGHVGHVGQFLSLTKKHIYIILLRAFIAKSHMPH